MSDTLNRCCLFFFYMHMTAYDMRISDWSSDVCSSDLSVEIGASIGIALHSENSRGLTTLMRNADLAMYHAKARGRGQVQIFTPALAAQSEDRRLIEQELRRALEHEQFEIYQIGRAHV